MKKFLILAGFLIALGACSPASAQVVYDLKCPAGSSVAPNGTARNPTNDHLKENICIDSTGSLIMNGCTSGCGNSVIASGAVALGTAAIASGACATTVTAVATGADPATPHFDTVSADFNADTSAVTGYVVSTNGILYIKKWVSANQVNFQVCNATSGSITPGAVTINWRVLR